MVQLWSDHVFMTHLASKVSAPVRNDTNPDNFVHRARVIHQKRPFIIKYTGPTSTITTPNMSKKGTDERAKTGVAIRLHTTGFFVMTILVVGLRFTCNGQQHHVGW